MAMIGVIVLAGIVVRNPLLIVDFIRELRAQGIALEQAAQDAGALRLRPVLLITLAIIALATAIMVYNPVFDAFFGLSAFRFEYLLIFYFEKLEVVANK